MKNFIKSTCYIFSIVAALPLITQCASQGDIQSLHYQLRIVSNKVDTIKADTVTSIQKRQASSSSQLDRLEAELNQLKSQIEEISHLNRLLQEQQKENRAALQTLSTKLDQQEEEARAIQAARIKEAERKAQEAQIAAERARAQRKQAELSAQQSRKASGAVETIYAKKDNKVIKYTPAAQQSQEDIPNPNNEMNVKTSTIPAEKLMQEAQAAYSKGDYQEAFNLFNQIINSNQSSSSSVTARFMMAESLFNMKQYNQAIMEYQKIISNYPRDPKAATSLFRQGNSFEQLSDIETAKMIYKKLISAHSSSPEAAQAQKLLEKL